MSLLQDNDFVEILSGFFVFIFFFFLGGGGGGGGGLLTLKGLLHTLNKIYFKLTED